MINDSDEPLNERNIYKYTSTEEDDIKDQKIILSVELRRARRDNKLIIFENQENIAKEVVSIFKNRKIINIMVLAKTQSGKTGSMISTIALYLEDNLIHINNIYIITGLSSCEWKEQTIERMPKSIEKIYHRDDLPDTFVDEIKNKKNILIIMDEIQVAAQKGQTIYKAFDNAGLLSKNKLYENDVKILEYTATPDGTIYDLMKWNESSHKILAKPGNGYIGAYNLFCAGRVKQYRDLCGYNKKTNTLDSTVLNNIQEIKKDIDIYDRSLYHFIRTKNGSEQEYTIKNFKKVFGNDNYHYIKYDGNSEDKNINKILLKKPTKHTFIFIKEMLRCAKTLEKKHIGILYERYSNSLDDTVIIQGLVGRNTGYDDNGISICYTNIESIKKYEKLWNSKFDDKSIDWKSKTTQYKKGNIVGKNTFNDPHDYGFSSSSDEYDDIEEPIIMEFKTFEMLKYYLVKHTKRKKIIKNPKYDNNGYYKANIRGNSKIYDYNEIIHERRWGFDKKIHTRYYPCYKNKNDKSSIRWLMISYLSL